MEKTAILLVNLGTPDTPEPASVKSYLKEFLSDPRVIDLPRIQWLPILHGIILRVRPKKSAKLYQSIWTEQGSPLLLNSQKQQDALQKRFNSKNIHVGLAMTYGNPSIASEVERLHKMGIKKLIVLPLFPQYSSTTTASVWDRVVCSLSKSRDIPELIFVRDYPDHPFFVKFLTNRIQTSIDIQGNPDCLVLSYHGIPLRYAETGDDYPSRCRKTTDAIQQHFPNLHIIESFQSKFGKEPWVEPSTSDTLIQLAKEGYRNIMIMAPSFTADCLETLEELEVENKELFLDAGGQSYHYIPAANDDPLFIDALEDIAMSYV
ncbi:MULTISPECIES: ferrochelatase [Bacillus]|uniref:ferrochelatase n=1 Tax=Bacillus TaxID=1386 RepID=UPI00030899D2|nr:MULTISPECIES: ferrochelatase [Bacillus]